MDGDVGVLGRRWLVKRRSLDSRAVIFERELLEHLRRCGVAVAEEVPTREGDAFHTDQWHYTCYRFIEGGSFTAESILPHAGEVGFLLARLHQALRSYTGQVPPHPYAGSGGRKLEGLPQQLIHRDFHPGNIMIKGLVLVDFDQACVEYRVVDLAYFAVSLLHHLRGTEKEGRWLGAVVDFVKGYMRCGELETEELNCFVDAMLYVQDRFMEYFVDTGDDQVLRRVMVEIEWLLSWRDEIHGTFETLTSSEKVF